MRRIKLLPSMLLVVFLSLCTTQTHTRTQEADKHDNHKAPPTLPHHLRSDRLRELFDYDPVAATAAQVVITPHIRLSILTDRVARIEESITASTFEDRATLAVLQRRFDPPTFTVTRVGSVVNVATKYLHITVDTAATNPIESIQITSVASNTKDTDDTATERADSFFDPWRLGSDPAAGNLLGTIRTLDALGPLDLNCNEVPLLNTGESLHCRFGLVSRKGWAVLNDTSNAPLNPVTTWWEPPASSSKTKHDLYFFGFGRKYKDAIKAYIQLSGKPPMLPRSSLGVWWTRWYNYDQHELQDIYEEMFNRRLPLDMLVLDMNWHRKPSWGGYSWDRSLFPFPDVAFQPFKDDGVPLMVNLHDDSGVSSREETFAHFASYLKVQDKRHLKFSSCNNSLYAFGLEDIVLENLMLGGKGVDYFWIDWQQGGDRGGCSGKDMNPTIWLNRIRSTRSRRLGYTRRDLILARWGGYGSHRYPVGFSGDVDKLTWDRLAYQPYFTLTAANVAYGYWSHDITGPLDDPELTLRWIQWAVFSPVIRFHDRGLSAGTCSLTFPDATVSPCAMAFVWQLPHRHYSASRNALELRLQLLPYMYNLMREYHKTGISPIRPMYYDFPREESAYKADRYGNYSQFMLGESLLVAPIVAPATLKDGFLARNKIWLPPGCWVEQSSNRVLHGPKELSSLYLLEEIPVWAKCGAIIPLLHTRRNSKVFGVAARDYEHLVLKIHLDPTVTTGQIQVYQDDGATLGYLHNNEDQLSLTYTYTSNKLTLTLSDAFATAALKSVTISLVNSSPLAKPVCSAACKTAYDAHDLVAKIEIPRVHSRKITITAEDVRAVDSSVKGKVIALRSIKQTLDYIRAGKMLPPLNNAATAFLHWDAHARAGDLNAFTGAIENFTRIEYPAARDSVLKLNNAWILPERKANINSLLARADGTTAVVNPTRTEAYSIMMKS